MGKVTDTFYQLYTDGTSGSGYYNPTPTTSIPYGTNGYTCSGCGAWVTYGVNTIHQCYTPTPAIQPAPYVDNSQQILTQLYMIMGELLAMKKRLDNIEEILDEEL